MRLLLFLLFQLFSISAFQLFAGASRPHIILVMADDMGYGQTGYAKHPVLKTPNLDAMAANGLRFDRFYAGASNCSPTRATVLTGRTNERTGVENHGFPLRLQEKTLPRSLRDAGYHTGHFGKWHLNGLRGPGVPILGDDSHSPGAFGFDTWLSATNFFDLNPILSRQGKFEEFAGDSSEIIVAEALGFIASKKDSNQPTFTVIWYGSPHSPMMASDTDRSAFDDLDDNSAHHYGELVAMDRSIGSLRKGLRELGIADNTLLWFNSDNGGLPKIKPTTVGQLRAYKGSMYEGGIRVPAIVEWPANIKPRITQYPAATMDIFPTVAEIVGLPKTSYLQPQDGLSLLPLFAAETGPRPKPIPFSHQHRPALIDNNHKLIRPKPNAPYELYDVANDPGETTNLIKTHPQIAARLTSKIETFLAGLNASITGADYPSGKVDPDQPPRQFWTEVEAYHPYFEAWKTRPEYKSRLK